MQQNSQNLIILFGILILPVEYLNLIVGYSECNTIPWTGTLAAKFQYTITTHKALGMHQM